MPSLLVRSNLSRGDLRLFLTNEEGYAADAASVRWTVVDPSGARVSGDSLPAIRAAVGEYYAPWFSDVRNGNYTIVWEIRETTSSAPWTAPQKFFVVDPSYYQSVNGAPVVLPGGFPVPGGLAYLSGTQLGPGDLPLYLRDDNGVLTDALGVFWTVQDVAGNSITPRIPAARSGVGSYWAPWLVNTPSGDFSVLWEFVRDASSPMQSAKLPFSVINPAAPVVNQVVGEDEDSDGCGCGGDKVIAPLPPGAVVPSVLINLQTPLQACGGAFYSPPSPSPPPAVVPTVPVACAPGKALEIPRIVHLVVGPLPPSGAFTDQPPFFIPAGVRHVTFYISYKRGAPGGFADFKLLWGNGTEEVQETVIDTDINGPSVMGQQGMFLQDLTGPAPSDDSTISFVLYVSVPGGAKTVRLLASEEGVPGIPGTVGITLTASSG